MRCRPINILKTKDTKGDKQMIDFNAALKKEPKEQAPSGQPGFTVMMSAFDLQPVKDRFAAVSDKIDGMVKASAAHEVKGDESEKKGIEMAGQAKSLYNNIEKQRKEWVEPHNKFVKAVNNLCKVYQEPLKEIESHQKRLGGNYQMQLEMKRREVEKKAQDEARKLQEKVNAEAKEKKIDPIEVPLPVAREPEKTKRTEEGSMTYISKWVPTIVDTAAMPDEYIIRAPNMKKINEAIKAGVRDIPGVQIDEVKEARLRT